MLSGISFSNDCIHLLVHDLICGTDPYPIISRQLLELLERFLRNGSVGSLCHQFQKRCTPFLGLGPSQQSFLIQIVALLGLDTVINQISSAALPQTWESPDDINWAHFLALVSTLVVATKGGVAVVKGLIYQLLTRVFQTSPERKGSDATGLVNAAFLDLEGDDDRSVELRTLTPVGGELNAFTLALLLARQLSSEDIRLTGFSYSQWWSETFGSDALGTQDCLLRSRADVILLSSLLLELLPLEFDPRLLQVQITSRPIHSGSALGKKSVNRQKFNQPTNIYENTLTSIPNHMELLVSDALSELDSLDSAYAESCVQRWNDYVEVGRGRLAELRELQQQEQDPMTTDLFHSTPGWDEVCGWLTEMTKQSTDGRAQRLPHGLTEAALFQPRRLRATLIPTLLHAPENDKLSDELREARARLIANMNQAGLGHILMDSNDPEDVQQKRTRGSSIKRPSATLPARGKTRRKC
ncbi:hypothetical protein CRM22_007695 [Opisthorchis felineus]|uniref:Uncharacterized protein n=1 Tax=Opisthorchis felineus TaxID=147828 RepID=A0A4S2LEG7_OPIFE|nr:hypothetical protein CRM22_007695 [Opisthorchis felineus]